MSVRIALAGNPNCGKTTFFNALTGSTQHVGNWPGVTVEKISGPLKGYNDVIIEDLPGIYSLSTHTPEELAARNCLISDPPDVIMNIIDGTHLERNLYLTTELIELGLPILLVVNMMDAVKKSGISISLEVLSKAFGCKATAASALKCRGCIEAAEVAISLVGSAAPTARTFSGTLERAIQSIEQILHDKAKRSLHWHAVKAFERDGVIIRKLHITDEQALAISDIVSACERELGLGAADIIAAARYAFIERALRLSCSNMQHAFSRSDAIDRIVTSRVLALPVFIVTMFLVYFVSFSTVGKLAGTIIDQQLTSVLPHALTAFFSNANSPWWLSDMVANGALAGVGAVLCFLPQMFILFMLLAVLEDVGYMARVAYIMDRLFRRFGLSGKSVIPLIIASGCGVPAAMSARTIESERERRMTVSVCCFVPCGAKMPMIGLFAGVFFGGSGVVAAVAYFIGIAAALLSGAILNRLPSFSGPPSRFMMELPPYRVPSASCVFRTTWQHMRSFILRAGTVILTTAMVLWFLKSFSIHSGAIIKAESADESLLAMLGAAIAFLFKPLGFGTWQAAVATLSGLLAKENIVGSLAVLYGSVSLKDGFSALSAVSFVMFNLLCAPCCAAVSAMRRELSGFAQALGAALYMTCFAYTATFVFYQIALGLSGQGFGLSTVAAAGALFIGLRILKTGSQAIPARCDKSLCGDCASR